MEAFIVKKPHSIMTDEELMLLRPAVKCDSKDTSCYVCIGQAGKASTLGTQKNSFNYTYKTIL